jgi:hypothetical protein
MAESVAFASSHPLPASPRPEEAEVDPRESPPDEPDQRPPAGVPGTRPPQGIPTGPGHPAKVAARDWPGYVADIEAAVRCDPIGGRRWVADAVADMEREARTILARFRRMTVAPVVREVWQSRLALLERRTAALRRLLPATPVTVGRPKHNGHAAAGAAPCGDFQATLADRSKDRTRANVRDAISTFKALRPEDLPDEILRAIPAEMLTLMATKRMTPPTQDQLDEMMLVIIGMTISISDPARRQVVFLSALGISYRRIAAMLDCSHAKVAQMEGAAVACLAAWLARHEA